MQRHTSFLEVNLSLLKKNVDKIRTRAGDAQLLPMVKGNAYGNGIGQIARHLVAKCGIHYLGVASLGEAEYLLTEKDPASGHKDLFIPLTLRGEHALRAIVVFSDTELHSDVLAKKWYGPENQLKDQAIVTGANEEEEDFKKKQVSVIPVLQSPKDVKRFLDLSSSLNPDVPMWIKINTGMNRMGLTKEQEVEEVISLLKSDHPAMVERNKKNNGVITVEHMMTHFSNADNNTEEGNKITEDQLKQFESVVLKFEKAGIHITDTSTSNSGGITRGLHLGRGNRWARCGLMMYGPSPLFGKEQEEQATIKNEDDLSTCPATKFIKDAQLDNINPIWDGHQICRFVTKVLSVRAYQPGESIGYGIYPLPEPSSSVGEAPFEKSTLVVTMPLGYADGFVKYYTGMTVTINGLHGKIHGGICMDTCFVAFPMESLKLQMKLDEFKAINVEDPRTWPFQPEQRIHIWEWDDNRSIQRMANEVKTITYALMCCLTPRIARLYVEEEETDQK